MRRLRLLGAGLLVAVAVLSIAGAAGATPAPPGVSSDNNCYVSAVHNPKYADAATNAAEGKALNTAITNCGKAPNPLIPASNELIWGTIGFAIVFAFLYWKGYPAIKKGMNDRTQKIQVDIAAAETQRTEASTILDQYKAQLADAKTEGTRIIEEARQTADALKRDLQAQAEADIAEMRAKNVADIEAAKVQAISDLRGEVATIAIGAAERVVERNLDHDTNAALIESFISQVGAGK